MMSESSRYDVIVVGGGHAGVEAANAAASLGMNTALVTMSIETICQMSCNPAIGGLAKGQIVREIDALGGLMGLAADAAGIQFRMLNLRKGPAVWGPRVQADKWDYQDRIRHLLGRCRNLTILEDTAARLVVENGCVAGIECTSGRQLSGAAVVLTTGTFLRGLMHVGPDRQQGGRFGEPASNELSESLEQAGLELGRLKTGTPPRIDANSIDYGKLQLQPGDERPTPFSFINTSIDCEQVFCWTTYTNETTHRIITENLDRAPLYTGQIASTGPRYCPSIETKIIRFADKNRHQLFLEPEGRDSKWIYCNGISTSLPMDVQEAMVHSIEGLQQAEFLRYGYAIEYDYVPPIQMFATLETKKIAGLYLAGQINGTSGYEEAAGLGLMAGLNAARKIRNQPPVILGRDTSYIGVMIDDLVTKGVDEPYRMFTSRAEHRLLLRSDNADERLTPPGREWGLVDDHRWSIFRQKQDRIGEVKTYLSTHHHEGMSLSHWLRQPGRGVDWLKDHAGELAGAELPDTLFQKVVNDIRYEGYVQKQTKLIERSRKMEHLALPANFDYSTVRQLRRESQEKLNRIQPMTLGQASRISGINPADITVLMIYLDRPQGGGAISK